MNETSTRTTVHTRRGSSNIDLTIINNLLVPTFSEWEISEDETGSDHNLIIYNIGQEYSNKKKDSFHGRRYVVKEDYFENLTTYSTTESPQSFSSATRKENRYTRQTNFRQITGRNKHRNISREIPESSKIQLGKIHLTKKRLTSGAPGKRTVPRWTADLSIRRMEINAMRRRYQGTKNNSELRAQRKMQYFKEKTKYEVLIGKEKNSSWKNYCNMTTVLNSWNVVYKLASGKMKENSVIPTLKRPDGSLTNNIDETMQLMMVQFIPQDQQHEETEYHKKIRAITQTPIETDYDREFSPRKKSDKS